MLVYLDLVVLLNFLVDFLLLLGTNRLAGFPSQGKRLLPAAALGGIYSAGCMLPGFRFLGNTLWRLVSLAGIAGIAFGWNRSTLKRCGVFILLSMALGGIALGFGRARMLPIVLSAVGVWLLCQVAFGGQIGQQMYVPVEIAYEEKTVRFIALRDSGNTLRDPVTGEQVLIVSADVAEKLTGFTKRQLCTPLETITGHPGLGLRLIPYRAVGQAGGMLLGMRFENVRIGSRKQSAVVAFAAEGLGNEEMYQGLTGGAL